VRGAGPRWPRCLGPAWRGQACALARPLARPQASPPLDPGLTPPAPPQFPPPTPALQGLERDKLKWGDADLFIVDAYNARTFPLDAPAKAAIDVKARRGAARARGP
jgi:hypothetical protein